MTGSQDFVEALRAALVDRDPARIAQHLTQVLLAVPVHEQRIRVLQLGSQRALPVFLSPESFAAYDTDDAVTAMPPEVFLRALEATAPDVVLFDPGLPTGVRLPTGDVIRLLRGVAPDDGSGDPSVVYGRVVVARDEVLRTRVRDHLRRRGDDDLAAELWAMRRVHGTLAVPFLALPETAAHLEGPLIAALQDADVPRDLEVTVLDGPGTANALRSWGALRVDAD
jgi:hypothetical protein